MWGFYAVNLINSDECRLNFFLSHCSIVCSFSRRSTLAGMPHTMLSMALTVDFFARTFCQLKKSTSICSLPLRFLSWIGVTFYLNIFLPLCGYHTLFLLRFVNVVCCIIFYTNTFFHFPIFWKISIIFILQIRKLRCRQGKSLFPGHNTGSGRFKFVVQPRVTPQPHGF